MNSLDYLLSRRAATMAGPWLSHASSLLVLGLPLLPGFFLPGQIRNQLPYTFNSHCTPYCMVIYLPARSLTNTGYRLCICVHLRVCTRLGVEALSLCYKRRHDGRGGGDNA